MRPLHQERSQIRRVNGIYTSRIQIKKVGVAGCGIMGAGIAQVCAQSGYEVLVAEKSPDILKQGLSSINSALEKSEQSGKLTHLQKETILCKITAAMLDDFKECDLVIEAVTENLDLKKDIFARLDKICPAHTILATNTSCLSITEIASATNRPDRILGMHFINPVPVMRPLEIVRTAATSAETLKTARDFGRSLGKTVLTASDTPGFLATRLGMVQWLEAIRMLEAGIGSKEDIDAAVKLSFNFPMGPLELIDFIGLDTLYFVASAMYEATADPKFAPPFLLKEMVDKGHIGRKAGQGFYNYQRKSQASMP